mgnify:CR=1 FL=1
MRLDKFTIVVRQKTTNANNGLFTDSETVGSNSTPPAAGFTTHVQKTSSAKKDEGFKSMYTSGSTIQGASLVMSGNLSAPLEDGDKETDIDIVLISKNI